MTELDVEWTKWTKNRADKMQNELRAIMMMAMDKDDL